MQRLYSVRRCRGGDEIIAWYAVSRSVMYGNCLTNYYYFGNKPLRPTSGYLYFPPNQVPVHDKSRLFSVFYIQIFKLYLLTLNHVQIFKVWESLFSGFQVNQ